MLDQDGEKYQQISSSSIKKYCGYYYADDKFYIVIEKGDNCLIYHANDNGNPVYSNTIYKVAEDEYKRSNMRLTFNEKNNNIYDKVFAFWGGDGYKYKRAIYKIEKDRLNYYIGNYELDNHDIVAISFNNRDLIVSLEKSDGNVLKFPAKGTNEFNFIYAYSRLIFDQFKGSNFQKIRLIQDNKELIGKRK